MFVFANATLFSMVLAGRTPFMERKVPGLLMQMAAGIENKVASALKKLFAALF